MFRSIATILPVLFSLFAAPLQARQIEVALHDIRELAETHSQEWHLLEFRRDYTSLEAEAMARPLNPSIAYDLEFLDNGTHSEYEHSLYLEKQFRTPSHYRNLRDYRDRRITLHERELHRDQSDWLAETRAGFIRIILAREEIELLRHLKRQVEQLTDAVEARAHEGEASLLDEQLLKMSSYQLQVAMDNRSLEMNRLIADWKSRMGLSGEYDIRFSGSFVIDDEAGEKIVLPPEEELLRILDDSPEAIAQRAALQSARQQTVLEQSRRWPSFQLEAGYMQMNPGWHGFLAGVSLPLPVLNANTASIERARIGEQMEQETYDATLQRRQQNIVRIMNALQQYENRLADFPHKQTHPESFLNALETAYEEGERTLSDVLNALGVLTETYRARFEQLETFYEHVTTLEALTGRTFIGSRQDKLIQY